ncbi:MAG: endonuclease/exonuclease/phosphatase family protein [Bacteroidales bacterium]|nr:endonuclease/exonuclease/phosphatase family protein [Bacteroidales bacterium]
MKRSLSYFLIIFLFVFTCCSKHSDENALKVITFNVRYDNPRDSANAWTNRASIICNFLKNEKPDLFGMQEVLFHQYEVLDSALTDYSSVGVGRNDGAKSGEMNPIFFKKERFDMVRTITFWLSETPGIPGSMAWGASLPRIVTWMELVDKKTHDHIFYFNTHFAHDSDSARIMSSKLLLSKVDSIASGFPFIITGDFNMLPDSKGYAILTGPAESVPLLKDSYVISEKRPEGPAYTFNGFSDKQQSGRIDYIFVKDGLKVLGHRTIIKKERNIYISDHWPVEALVLIK